MSAAELDACRALQERASVLPEARIARGFAGVRAMHDVTEGGLATALRELAAATGRGVLVHRDRIPVSAGTRRICDLLGADPLGLIASGSLLVCCDPEEAPALLAALAAAGIAGRRHRRADGRRRRGGRAGARPAGAVAGLRDRRGRAPAGGPAAGPERAEAARAAATGAPALRGP